MRIFASAWSRVRRAVIAMVALMGLVVVPVMAAPAAQAAPSDCRYCSVGEIYGGSGWAGAYRLPVGGQDRDVYCVDPEAWYAQGSYTHTGTQRDHNSMLLGYIMGKWGGTRDRATATQVSMLVALHGAGNDGQWRSFPHYQGAANAKWDEAARNAGPYNIVSDRIVTKPTWENGAYFEIDFEIHGRSGALTVPMPEWQVQATSTDNVAVSGVHRVGNGTFRVTGNIIEPSRAWRVGLRTVNTWGGADRWRSSVPQAQDVVSVQIDRAGDPRAVSGEALMYRPQVTTVTSDVLAQAGAQVRDTIAVTAGEPGAAFTGVTTLYGPFASNEEALSVDVSGLTPVGEVPFAGTFDAGGSATVVSDAVTIPRDGFYVWVERLDATQRSLAWTQRLEDRVTEMSLAAAPEITSQISDARVVDGDTVTDEVTLTGVWPTVGNQPITWTLTGGLYGPVPVGEDGTCPSAEWDQAPLVESLTRVIDPAEITAGTATVGGFDQTVSIGDDPAARCFSYGWDLTGEAPDGTSTTVTHPAGDPAQTTVVTFAPLVASRVSNQLIDQLPAQVTDVIEVSDGIAGLEFRGRSTLFGPFASNEEALTAELLLSSDGDAVSSSSAAPGEVPGELSTPPAGDPATPDTGTATGEHDMSAEPVTPVGSVEFTGVFDADGTATVTIEPVEITELGYYVWVEELFEHTNGGEAIVAEVDARAPETLVALAPQVATAISDQSAERGSVITDDVIISGLELEVGDHEIVWSGVTTLYGPVEPNAEGTCEGLEWENAEVVTTEEFTVDPTDVDQEGAVTLTGVGRYEIPQYGPRGCYTYGELVTGQTATGAQVTVVHEPGHPTQTTLVPFGGMITTGFDASVPRLPGGGVTAALIGAGAAVLIAVVGRRRVTA